MFFAVDQNSFGLDGCVVEGAGEFFRAKEEVRHRCCFCSGKIQALFHFRRESFEIGMEMASNQGVGGRVRGRAGVDVQEESDWDQIDLLDGPGVFFKIKLMLLEDSHSNFLELAKIFGGL